MPEPNDKGRDVGLSERLNGYSYFDRYDDAYFKAIMDEVEYLSMPHERRSFADYVRLHQMAQGRALMDIIRSELDGECAEYWNEAKEFLEDPVSDRTDIDEDSMDEDSMDEDLISEDSLDEDSMDEDLISEDSLDEDSMDEDLTDENSIDEVLTDEDSLEDAQQQRIREYGEMFRRASEQLMKEEFPVNWRGADRESSMQLMKAAMLGDLAEDYIEIKRSLESEKDFSDVFGGSQNMVKTDKRIELAMTYGQCVKYLADPSAEEGQRFMAQMMFEQYGRLFAGKSIRSLPASSNFNAEIIKYLESANYWYNTATPEQKSKMEQYLGGAGAKPEEVFDQISLDAQERFDRFLRVESRHNSAESRLEPADHGAVQGLPLFGDDPERRARYYDLRERSGELAETQKESPEEKKRKQDLIREGNFCFQALCRRIGLDTSHPMYADAGYDRVEDLFFIDGVPAGEYVKNLYHGQDLAAMANGKEILQAEIISAVLSGKHHVEAAKLGLSGDQAYDVGVVEVRLDGTALDGQESFYRTKPSKKAEKFYSSDKNREARQADIRGKVSGRFAAAAAKKINETEYQKNPYVLAAERFSQDQAGLTDDYFDDLSMRQLNWISADSLSMRQMYGLTLESPEERKPFGKYFSADNFKGFRALAQLKLLADHPEIRVADLTDPNKYRDEKIAAGGLVSEACYRYFMGPHMADSNDQEYMKPLVEIVHSAMRAVGNMDVRKELLYALGEPMDLEGDEAIHVMKEQEHFASVNSFLSNLNDLAHTGKIAFATLDGEKSYMDLAKLKPEKADSYPPVYDELLKSVDPDTMKRYTAAARTLSALSCESSWKKGVEAYLSCDHGQDDPGKLHMMETEALTGWIISSYMREKIAKYGKAAEIPEAADMAEVSNMDSWQHGLLERYVREGLKNKTLTMSEQMTEVSAPKQTRQWISEILSEMNELRKEKGKEDLARVKVAFSEMEKAGRIEKKKPLTETAAEKEKTHSEPKKGRSR